MLNTYVFRMLVTAFVLAFAPHPAVAKLPPPVIAAASSLRFVLGDIAKAFTRETGLSVRLSYGSSGNLSRQITQGAPYQMFMSADEAYVRNLAKAGRMEDDGAIYGYGRIVLFIGNGSALANVKFPDGYGAAFAVAKKHRFAIANPAHAPYGRAAREALIHAGLWAIMEPSLLYGENVAQAAQFAASGSADGGIIAESLALQIAASGRGIYWLVPTDWYAPLGQRMALVKGAGETARKFYTFMGQPEARKLLSEHGFAGTRP